MKSIQGDTYTYPGALFAKEFVTVMSGSKRGENAGMRETLDLLRAWQGKASSDSRAALIAVLMRDAFRRRVVAGMLGAEAAKDYQWSQVNIFMDQVLTERRPEWLPRAFKSYDELFAVCESDARSALAKKLGDDNTKWTWGQFEQFRFPHPLAGVPLIGKQFAIAPIPQNGSVSSVNVGNAVSMRFIADPGDWDQTRHGVTLGESGVPNSPHWKDQLTAWVEVNPATFPFTKTAVANSTKISLVMQPK
jgi:penicillin amidase